MGIKISTWNSTLNCQLSIFEKLNYQRVTVFMKTTKINFHWMIMLNKELVAIKFYLRIEYYCWKGYERPSVIKLWRKGYEPRPRDTFKKSRIWFLKIFNSINWLGWWWWNIIRIQSIFNLKRIKPRRFNFRTPFIADSVYKNRTKKGHSETHICKSAFYRVRLTMKIELKEWIKIHISLEYLPFSIFWLYCLTLKNVNATMVS